MASLRHDLARLYDEFGPQLYGCALAVTGRGELAEDAVHDAFGRVLRTGNAPADLKAYVFRSVRNAAVDIMRRRSRVATLRIQNVFDCSRTTGRGVENEGVLEQVVHGLWRLTENERETVVQHLVAGLTFREIADLQGRPMGTVTSWYHRGLTKLKEIVGK